MATPAFLLAYSLIVLLGERSICRRFTQTAELLGNCCALVCNEGRRIVRRPPAKKLRTAIYLFLFAFAVLSVLQLLLVPLPAEFLMCTVSVDFLQLFCQLGSNFEICSSLFLLAPYLCHRLLNFFTDLLNLTPPDLWMFNNGLYLLFTTSFSLDVSAFDAILLDRCQPRSA